MDAGSEVPNSPNTTLLGVAIILALLAVGAMVLRVLVKRRYRSEDSTATPEHQTRWPRPPLIAITVCQQIENYLISPKITANTMDLHPAVAFGSAIVGASLLGGLGALLALPVAAAATALTEVYGTHHELIESEDFESPEDYEARMREVDEAKTRRKHDLRRRWLRRGGDPAAAETTGS